MSFNDELINLLKTNPHLVDDEGELLIAAVQDRAWKIDHDLIKLLLSDEEIKSKFFDEIEGHWVFNINTFLEYITQKNLWEPGRVRVSEAGSETCIADDLEGYHTGQLKFDSTREKLSFDVGRVYNRQQDLHDQYGDNRQSGISPCSEYPLIFLFTSSTGDQFGYEDFWRSDREYIYTGEGQIGDMEMSRGNRAIRDHEEDGRALHLFKQVSSGLYEYLGEFRYEDHEIVRGEDAEGKARDMIRFVLKKM